MDQTIEHRKFAHSIFAIPTRSQTCRVESGCRDLLGLTRSSNHTDCPKSPVWLTNKSSRIKTECGAMAVSTESG